MDRQDFIAKYSPLVRLLTSAEADRLFLRRQNGFSRELEDEYEQIRRTAILGYLRCLSKDWADLYQDALPHALNDPALAKIITDVDGRLKRAIHRVRLRLFLNRCKRLSRLLSDARETQRVLLSMNSISCSLPIASSCF
jgi:hypothetical protein